MRNALYRKKFISYPSDLELNPIHGITPLATYRDVLGQEFQPTDYELLGIKSFRGARIGMLDWGITAIGALAAIFSMISFLPQAWTVIRTRDTKSLSPGMYALTVAAFAAWSIYGIALQSWPLVFSNLVCLVLSAFILVMTLLPQPKKKAAAEAVLPHKE